MRHEAHHRQAKSRRSRAALLLTCSMLLVPVAAARDAGAAKPATSSTATVPSCADLTWTKCSRKLKGLGFTNYERSIDPYNNCLCGPAGVWRIIDDHGERIEGLTIPKDAHFLVQTNPD